MHESEQLPEDARELRRVMRDIVALSALPAVWAGYTPREIASSVADILARSMSLDLVYVRLESNGEEGVEIARGRREPTSAEQLARVASALKPWLQADGEATPIVDNPLGEGALRLAVTRLGYTGDVGVMAAGSRRAEFPTSPDTLLLGIAANQSAIMIQQKRLEARLREVAADLSEANRRKDEFLATLAHELRNPLAPIRTGLEVMKMSGALPAVMEEIRGTMERQVLQMVRLIDDLMDVSRITRGKVELRKSRLNLGDVVKSAAEASRPFIDAAGHSLSVELPPAPIALEADPHRLAQILSNLLNNAAKYTPEGGSIALSVEERGGEVLLSVKDDGIGIPAAELKHIFDMFVQIERPLEKEHTGLGIGLTLVKSFAELHGGSVEVHSDGPGHGSEFRVRLPVSGGSRIEELKAVPAEVFGDRHRVLIVDDNEAAAEMLSKVVEMLGNDVRTAPDGERALAIASEFLPDVILLDLGMPGLNGYEVAREIRRQPWGGKVSLIALTGWGQTKDRRRTKAAGFDHHLVKPADPSQLRRLFGELKARNALGRS